METPRAQLVTAPASASSENQVEASPRDYRYSGFMSYRHDARQGEIARRLQYELHRFAKPFYRLRAVRLYRDETNLAARPDLWGQIEAALDRSRYFVLMASPAAAESRWVKRELEHWFATRGPDSIIIVLTDGTLLWDSENDAFDPKVTDALPASTLTRFDCEPLWYDLTWVADLGADLNVGEPRFRDAVASISSTLRGIDKDELSGDDIREQRRTKRLALAAIGAIGVLLAAALVAAVGFFMQREEAARARDIAEAERDNALARLLAAEGHRRSAVNPAAGTPYFLSSLEIQHNPSAVSGLFRNLQSDPHIAMQLLPTAAPPTAAAIRGAVGAAVVGLANGDVVLWSLGATNSADGEQALLGQAQSVRLPPGPEAAVLAVALEPQGRHITALDALGGLYRWALGADGPSAATLLATLPVAEAADTDSGAPEVRMSANGATVAIAGWTALRVWREGRTLTTLTLPQQAAGGPVALSADGRHLASVVAGLRPPAVVRDLDTGALLDVPAPRYWPGALEELAFSPDGRYLAGATMSFDGTGLLWSLAPAPRFVRYIEHPEKGRPNISPAHDRIVFNETTTFISTYHRRRWHIWDLATGIAIGDPIAAPIPVSAYAGGRPKLLVATAEGVQLVDHSFEHMHYWACLRSGRPVPADEWRDVVGSPSVPVDPCLNRVGGQKSSGKR